MHAPAPVCGDAGSAPLVDIGSPIHGFSGALSSLGRIKDALSEVFVTEVTSSDDDDDDNDSIKDEEEAQRAAAVITLNDKKKHATEESDGQVIAHHEHINGNKKGNKATTIAFAFDIDGVLMRGKTPIPGARETLQRLQKQQIPFIFLTNGGGLTEAAHVANLGSRLSLDLDVDQFVQSHTPFRDLVGEFGDKTVLALGGAGQAIREVALAYGFTSVVTSSDIMAAWNTVHPFPEMTRAHHVEHGRPLPPLSAPTKDNSNNNNNINNSNKNSSSSDAIPPIRRISAIMVFSSPRDWCLDLQIATDLLLSTDGIVGGARSPKNGDPGLPNHGYLQDGQPRLFFCNPDFEWATSHPQPRFAQGAFREALRGVWRHVTGGKAGELEYTLVGKPTGATYAYGEKVLKAYSDSLVLPVQQQLSCGEDGDSDGGDYDDDLGSSGASSSSSSSAGTSTNGNYSTSSPPFPNSSPRHQTRDISHVYMIGDNPESDIAGANAYMSQLGTGTVWESILVETGVYVPGTKPAHEPSHIAADVASAVEWALRQHGERDGLL